MAIRIIIDGRTMNEAIDMNLGLIQAVSGEYISSEDIKNAIEMQPKSVKCIGYTYTRDDDGRIEFVVSDEAMKRINTFTMSWAPAIAGLSVTLKAQVKAIKKFMKSLLKAHRGLVDGLKSGMTIDGMSEEKWIEESAKKWSNHFDDVLKSKSGKTLEQKIDELNQYQEDLVNGKTKFELGTTEYIDEMVRVAKELGKLKAEHAAQKAEKE